MPDIFEANDIQTEPKENESSPREEDMQPTHPQEHAPQPQIHQPMHEPTITPDTPTVIPPQPPLSKSETHIHALASFCQHPQGIHFNTQGDTEQILLFLRAHFITNVPWIVITILFIFLPLVLAMFLPQLSPGTLFELIPPAYITILLSFYYLVLFAYAFISFITWLYNIFFVTTQRIVDIDFSNVVYHQVAATKKELIEDVHFDQIGFIPSLFDFGTVSIATASEIPIFEATNVPHPGQAVRIIENIIGKKH